MTDKFNCTNGSFEILTINEYRNFNNGFKNRSLTITTNESVITIDGVEKILTEPSIITDFSITDGNGKVLSKFEGYTLVALNKSSQTISGVSEMVISIQFQKVV
jgi:hypothetical protein